MKSSQPKPQHPHVATASPTSPSEREISEKESLIANLAAEHDIALKLLVADRGELRNLGEKIIVKKQQLEAAQEAIFQAEGVKQAKLSAIDREIEDRIDRAYKLEKTIVTLKSTIVELRPQSAIIRTELETIKGQIIDRRQYSDEQEAIIEDLAREGGSRLWDLNKEIDEANLSKEEVLKEIISLKRTKTVLEDDIPPILDKTKRLQERYQELSADLTAALADLRRQVDEAKVNYQKLSQEADQRVQAVEVREREIEIKEQTLESTAKNLRDRELRFKSNQSIYGL